MLFINVRKAAIFRKLSKLTGQSPRGYGILHISRKALVYCFIVGTPCRYSIRNL